MRHRRSRAERSGSPERSDAAERLFRSLRRLVAVGGLSAACLLPVGCRSSQTAPLSPFGASRSAVQSAVDSGEIQLADTVTPTEPDGQPGFVRTSRPVRTPDAGSIGGEPTVVAADRIVPTGNVMPVSWQVEGSTAVAQAVQPVFTPAEPRTPPQYPATNCNTCETVGGGALADMFPDEYLLDGGDRDLPVHYYGGARQGLETEDTIVEFRDHTGDHHVRPSNRVAVYAPRFGSVRAVVSPGIDIDVESAAGATDVSATGTLHIRHSGMATVEHQPAVGLAAQSRVDGVRVTTPPHSARKADNPIVTTKVDSGLQGVGTSGRFTIEQFHEPMMQERIRYAIAWSRRDFPMLSAASAQAGETFSTSRLQATVGVEDQRKNKGSLRIVKLADRETALPGDVVTFTIWYQNSGDFPVSDVRIVDNLTPRLKFVSGSATTEHEGEVVVDPNGEGSDRLTFVFSEPLPGGSSGVVQFSAEVR